MHAYDSLVVWKSPDHKLSMHSFIRHANLSLFGVRQAYINTQITCSYISTVQWHKKMFYGYIGGLHGFPCSNGRLTSLSKLARGRGRQACMLPGKNLDFLSPL